MIVVAGPFCLPRFYSHFLLSNKRIVAETLKNQPQGILRYNPVRVLQQSLGSPPCGAPQVSDQGMSRTPMGFHSTDNILSSGIAAAAAAANCGTPLGFKSQAKFSWGAPLLRRPQALL
jgi:hypothetical protein